MLTAAEAIAACFAAVPALLIVAAYLLDRIGMAFTPRVMLVAAFVASATALLAAWPRTRRDASTVSDLGIWVAIVVVMGGWLVWLARPTFFPLGSGPDLTHHLLLIQYIERHWRLVHQAGVEDYLGEMVYYTPGSHIVAALAGAWTRTTGLHVLHTVLAATVGLKAGFVFLIARRSIGGTSAATAALASVALFAAPTYVLGSFVDYSFVAQVVAEFFAVAIWWAVTAWDDGTDWRMPAFIAIVGAATFLTWPIFVGPPLALLGLIVLLPGSRSWRARVGHALLAAAPIVVVAALFIAGRTGMMVIAGTGGEAIWPRAARYGGVFLVFSTLGLAWSALQVWRPQARAVRCGRTTFLFAAAIAMQAAALYAFATAHHNVPYMALKMFYLLLYPQAVGVALAISVVWSMACRLAGLRPGPGRVIAHSTGWALVAVAIVVVAGPIVRGAGMPMRRRPAASRPLEQAGQWARANLPHSCVEYLVGDDETAYWLHLAVLGNPRAGARTASDATYELTPTLVRWLTPGGLPYAVADLPSLPADIRTELDIVRPFGTAAVVRRRGPSACDEPMPTGAGAGP